ncbi:MAG: preprotein translocase subunit SecE, partial [Solirubrobacterales bacterium]|nr:preprotein translocase subunit SecE [Solirubrobacterales bacterium]
MARNRKRANQRRTRRPSQADGSPQGERSSVPGVLPGVPTVTHEPASGLEPEENGVPDPLEHATPDVELADAQLAFGRPAEPEPGDEADEEEFELEAEEAFEERGGGRRGGGKDGGPAHPAHPGDELAAPGPGRAVEAREGLLTRLVGFLQGSWRELQRVQWPDRRQVMQATGVVIGFVIV